MIAANTLERPALEFSLTPELEAGEPPEARGLRRDEVRLLVTSRRDGSVIHTRFTNFADFLTSGDVVVVNTSATLPAALSAQTANGNKIEVHVSTSFPAGLTVVEPRNTVVHEGDVLTLPDQCTLKLLAPYQPSKRLWIASLHLNVPLVEYLGRWGAPIRYPYVKEAWPIDYYQTVFALHPGSAEMPSAGRPFSETVVEQLIRKGVIIARILLHCGVASPERDEPPYEEYFEVPAETVSAISSARLLGKRVIAVGTTVARALESSIDGRSRLTASRGWTNHLIDGSNPISTFDALLTGFHEPRSTHLAILQALAGEDRLDHWYREAIRHGYLWHEFGDSHLIL